MHAETSSQPPVSQSLTNSDTLNNAPIGSNIEVIKVPAAPPAELTRPTLTRPTLRRTTRARHPPNRYGDVISH